MAKTKKVSVTFVTQYNGHNLKPNGNVDIAFKSDYSELANGIQLSMMLNNDVSIEVKLPDSKERISLGTFRLKELKIQSDGESVIRFNSMTDFVEVDALNKLVTSERFKVRCAAEIELEE